MGCFDSSCVLSHIPAHYGHKSMLMFVVKNRYHDLNKGPFQIYSAVSFPIRGEYNDYGSLEKIERDKNVEMLESYFGTDIDTLQDFAHRWGEDADFKYLRLTNPIFKIYGKTFTKDEFSPENLKQLGFEVIKEDGELDHPWLRKARENGPLKYLEPNQVKPLGKFMYKNTGAAYNPHEVTFFSDETEFTRKGIVVREYGDLNEKFSRGMKSYYMGDFMLGFPTDYTTLEKIKLLFSMSKVFIDPVVYDAIAKDKKADHCKSEYAIQSSKERFGDLQKLSEEYHEYHDLLKTITKDSPQEEKEKLFSLKYEWNSTDRCRRVVWGIEKFKEIYLPNYRGNEEFINKSILDFETFNYAMSIMNIVVAPTYSGEQYTDLREQAIYRNIIDKAFKKRYKDEALDA